MIADRACTILQFIEMADLTKKYYECAAFIFVSIQSTWNQFNRANIHFWQLYFE